MTAQSTISLYTEDYYEANKTDIDSSSRCGNIAELVTIDNYVYVAIKATEYPFDNEGNETDYRQYNESSLITDLDDLRAGIFSSYRMIVEEFLQVKNTQRTAGNSNDSVIFQRFTDPVYGGRWRLTLFNRASVDAFSIKVYNNDGAFLYTPGSFIDQGDGTWVVESNYQEYDGGDVNIDFIQGSESITQIYHIDKDLQELEWDINYFTEVVSSAVDMSESEVYITTDNLGRRLSREEIETILDDNGIVLTEDTRFFIEDSAVSVFYVYYTAAIDDYFYELLSRAN